MPRSRPTLTKHAAAVKADESFYRDWLDPKVTQYLSDLQSQQESQPERASPPVRAP